jgi:hypothetical protein
MEQNPCGSNPQDGEKILMGVSIFSLAIKGIFE